MSKESREEGSKFDILRKPKSANKYNVLNTRGCGKRSQHFMIGVKEDTSKIPDGEINCF